jgi:uncharacterized membrane protein
MSEHRDNRSNDRSNDRDDAAREGARVHKVTPENSVLRNNPEAASERYGRDPQSHGSPGHGATQSAQERERELEHHAEQLRTERERHDRHWGDRERHWGDDTRRAETTGRSGATVTTLLRDLANDASELVRKEVALARGEIGHAISELKTGTVSLAAGGGVLYAGLLFLLLAATFGFATVMPFWLAALIVGAVVTLIGYIMVRSGQKRFQADHFKPDRTAESLRKDREMLERRTS